MSRENFSDAALVVVGHGSAENAESAAPVFQHAAELRRRGLFAAVHEAFWKQEPRVTAVVAGISAPRAFIVPLFISEGYFSEAVIPRELGFNLAAEPGSRIQHRAAGTLFYCRPVGTHERMTQVLLARARGVVARFPFPHPPSLKEVTLFIAGHGTGQYENSRSAIDRQVAWIRARKEYAAVHGIFLEEEPRIGDCYRLAQTRCLIVVPFFISEGVHTQEDIPALLGEAKAVVEQRRAAGQPAWRNPMEQRQKLVWYGAVAGTAPEVAEVILERVREAAA